jgi:RecB family exonuclease
MLEDLKRFAADESWPRQDFTAQVELKFVFPLGDSLDISGRIDRLDTTPDGSARIVDYKYSAAQRVKDRKNGNGLQAPLYLMAAEKNLGVRPARVFFVALKGGAWHPHPPTLATAISATRAMCAASKLSKLQRSKEARERTRLHCRSTPRRRRFRA